MDHVKDILGDLYQKYEEDECHPPIPFEQFIRMAVHQPQVIIRNIFQLFHDMIHANVVKRTEELHSDPESISHSRYDCRPLFEDGADKPFFADRLFSRRFMNWADSLRHGAQPNRINLFEGPHGCGKSTFLTVLLDKFEQYTRSDEGASYETVWRLDERKLCEKVRSQEIFSQLDEASEELDGNKEEKAEPKTLVVPCPSHDHPLLLIPKSERPGFLDQLIKDEDFKAKLFSEKQYAWVFRDEPCTICLQLLQTAMEKAESAADVFSMVWARRYVFNRRLGQGISVFNPGDRLPNKGMARSNEELQKRLNTLLKDSNLVTYIFSNYAVTNNGVYALMDLKDENYQRFLQLHGIISEQLHKVEDIEERVKSLVLVVCNPEDRRNNTLEHNGKEGKKKGSTGQPERNGANGSTDGSQSLEDRTTIIRIPYLLDYRKEVNVLETIFGCQIKASFLPGVVESWAKVIISTRLSPESAALREWIANPREYKPFCDDQLLLLKMAIYADEKPEWLSEEDRKNLTIKRLDNILAEAEKEGEKGFSDRDSPRMFNEFHSEKFRDGNLITIEMVSTYFKRFVDSRNGSVSIPSDLLSSVIRSYGYQVLQEVKASLYPANDSQISTDVQNYLFAITCELGQTVVCPFTKQEVAVNEEYLLEMERHFWGGGKRVVDLISLRELTTSKFGVTMQQEIIIEGKQITQTGVFTDLYQRYTHNLKENVLDPLIENTSFRQAILDYGTDTFEKTHDYRIRRDVSSLMENLQKKFNYTEPGAKQICLYVIDNNLARVFR